MNLEQNKSEADRVPGGTDRKTHKMMRVELETARKTWIKKARDDKKLQERREESDFLAYRNHAGLYADFHSCRHLFITSLERAGSGPRWLRSWRGTQTFA